MIARFHSPPPACSRSERRDAAPVGAPDRHGACQHALVEEHAIDRYAVLRDYPLRLWVHQQEYTDGLLREFNLLLIGEQSGEMHSAAPGQLVELAAMFTRRFGHLIDAITQERREALDRGLDRIDSRIPLIEGGPALLEQRRVVLDRVDEFCRHGDLLILPRPPDLVRLAEWTHSEIVKQYDGVEPTPWPGPF